VAVIEVIIYELALEQQTFTDISNTSLITILENKKGRKLNFRPFFKIVKS
jgi:hypothetical protein